MPEPQQPAPGGPPVGGPLLHYAAPGVRRDTSWPLRRTVALAAAAVVLGGCLFGNLVNPHHPREPSIRARCANNIRQIGLACLMYTSENGGRFPDTIDRVLLTQEITADVFVCPASSDERATGPTTQAVAANLTAGGHLSYVYVGAGLTADAPPTAVVAFEAPSNHQHKGLNILYADAHVEWHDMKSALRIIAAVQAGRNPPGQ